MQNPYIKGPVVPQAIMTQPAWAISNYEPLKNKLRSNPKRLMVYGNGDVPLDSKRQCIEQGDLVFTHPCLPMQAQNQPTVFSQVNAIPIDRKATEEEAREVLLSQVKFQGVAMNTIEYKDNCSLGSGQLTVAIAGLHPVKAVCSTNLPPRSLLYFDTPSYARMQKNPLRANFEMKAAHPSVLAKEISKDTVRVLLGTKLFRGLLTEILLANNLLVLSSLERLTGTEFAALKSPHSLNRDVKGKLTALNFDTFGVQNAQKNAQKNGEFEFPPQDTNNPASMSDAELRESAMNMTKNMVDIMIDKLKSSNGVEMLRKAISTKLTEIGTVISLEVMSRTWGTNIDEGVNGKWMTVILMSAIQSVLGKVV